MIAALDVHYDDAEHRATAAAVIFENWNDAHPAAEYTASISDIEPYVPGEFFRRELPCLLAVIEKIPEPLHAIVVDSYVTLGDKPGLGQHLFERLGSRILVIGVAKTEFHAARAVDLCRGVSQSPLYITAAGVDPNEAARFIQQMHGPHRIPTLLKQVDRRARAR
jgi:deoxyribonuclease V